MFEAQLFLLKIYPSKMNNFGIGNMHVEKDFFTKMLGILPVIIKYINIDYL